MFTNRHWGIMEIPFKCQKKYLRETLQKNTRVPSRDYVCKPLLYIKNRLYCLLLTNNFDLTPLSIESLLNPSLLLAKYICVYCYE